ncbi:MAG TPA: hypothetical protein VGW33_11920 [Terriglobia bacterium]|nr:hypothetical protein [Terriglobia bacterium]
MPTSVTRCLGLLVFLLLAAGSNGAAAECQDAKSLDAYINCRIVEIAKATITQSTGAKQAETPSISADSTSLVDQSSASDLFAVALNLAGANANSSGLGVTPASVSASAYALYTSAKELNPLDPAIYSKYRDWRRVSFTLGKDAAPKGATNTGSAAIVGAKVLILNWRDASDPRYAKDFDHVTAKLQASAQNYANIASSIEDYLYQVLRPKMTVALGDVPTDPGKKIADKIKFLNAVSANPAAALQQLSLQQIADIDNIISTRIGPQVELIDSTRELVSRIRSAPQFSVAFQSSTGAPNGIDDYRGEAVLDRGVLSPRINLTLNSSFDQMHNKQTGVDMRGGRAAGEFQFQLNPTSETKLTNSRPWLLSLGAQGQWMTRLTPTYELQAKLTIPLFSGVDFPVSVSWANRTALIKESRVKGHFGFTLDVAKLLAAFKSAGAPAL